MALRGPAPAAQTAALVNELKACDGLAPGVLPEELLSVDGISFAAIARPALRRYITQEFPRVLEAAAFMKAVGARFRERP